MAFAHSNGIRIYYRLEGNADKPLLVLAHSLGSDHGLWDGQVPALLPHFQVLRLDVRGHGASDAPAGDYSVEQLSRDSLAAVRCAGARPFAFCGLSLGGMMGLWLAANAPAGMLRGVALANTSPRVPDPGIFAARRNAVLEGGMAVAVTPSLERSFSPEFRAARHPAVDTIRNTLLATDAVGYAGCCAAIRDQDQRELMARVRVPTLVIGGDRDVSMPWPGNGQALAEGIPGARAVVLHAAHFSNLEQPEEFNRALVEFLLALQ
ncbi:MAG TPA: alpha/beta fold hydrolase [Bryobacteraceae bacterium]|nr:alpha/beta fold hydrolase [Bryobacteraceae bacterium]